MIVCPRCFQENEDSAVNCVSCGVNLQWARENPDAAAPDGLQQEEGQEREAQPVEREVKGKTRPIPHVLLAILLALAATSSIGWALVLLFFAYTGFVAWDARAETARVGLLYLTTGVFCILGAVALLRRKTRPILRVASVVLAVIAVIVGVWFCYSW